MVGAILLIFNDPMDRLLPVARPLLAPGPETTWDPAVVAPDGRLDWAAAAAQGRSALPGAPGDAWPQLQAALTAAGLPQAVPERTLADLRAGKRPEPDPAADERLRAVVLPAFTVLATVDPAAVYAVVDPPQSVRASALSSSSAHEAVRQLIRAASPPDGATPAMRLVAAGRLAALVPVAAGLEDLDGAALAHRAEAGLWRNLAVALAARPGDPTTRQQAVAFTGSAALRLPAMPAALRRARLEALRACHDLHGEVSGHGAGRLQVNAPPDINHALALLNRWFDQLGAVLPSDLADGHRLAGLAADAKAIPELDLAGFRDGRTLAARMLFDQAVDERRRQTGAVLATLVELQVVGSVSEAVGMARRAVLLRAAVHSLLAVPVLPGATATTAAAALNAALPRVPGSSSSGIVFRADGPSVRLELRLGDQPEAIASITTDGP